MKPVVAYVDDDKRNLEHYQNVLGENFEVKTFLSSHDFLSSLDHHHYDSYVFDIYMPCMNGFQLFEELTKHPTYKKAPVFYVTSSPQDEDRINSFRSGGVDYFDRMLSDEELIVRLGARISLFKNHNQLQLKLGGLEIDYMSLECRLKGAPVSLTLIELKILSTLVRVHPRLVPRDTLLKEVWGSSIMHQNNLNTHFYNLRLKLSEWEYEIKSHKTQGISLTTKA